MVIISNKAEINELIKDGLFTDGVHHKQWFLEQIYLKLNGKPAPVYYAYDGETPLSEPPIDNDEDYYYRDEGVVP